MKKVPLSGGAFLIGHYGVTPRNKPLVWAGFTGQHEALNEEGSSQIMKRRLN